MEEKTKLTKAIVFVVITFIFAFVLLTGKLSDFSSKHAEGNLAIDNSSSLNDMPKNMRNDIKPPLTTNTNSEKKESIKNKDAILGAWQLTEINSQSWTEKIDLTKPIPPEQNLIYNFEANTIYLYWGNSKIPLSYTWTKNDTIQTVQKAASANEKDYIEWATVRIEGDKLFMTTVDVNSNKSEGVFVKYKGELPSNMLNPKKSEVKK